MTPPKNTATISVTIKAPITKVWEYLTQPELIKTYLFGTETETDWKPGSPIFFRGSWEGKSYEDKGTVLEFTPFQHISYRYWSSFSGLADLPENYRTVVYELRSEKDETTLTVHSDCLDADEKGRCETNWRTVLDALKKQAE
jgi:uncharacterized protein YndB with AHSA1/START domain